MMIILKRPVIAQAWRHELQRCVCNAASAIERNHTPSSLAHRLLSGRKWLFKDAGAELTPINTTQGHSFHILRDDLSGNHFLNGNKRRKLDALIPQLLAEGVTDIVTCGGTQSAHTLAVASAASENGVRSHLLVRGERPIVPTGNHLYARMLAHSVTYVKRAEYARRSEMLEKYATALREEQENDDNDGVATKKVVAVVPEGGADGAALLGMLRLIEWLANSSGAVEKGQRCTLVVDSGTGTSAIGLSLGVALLDLPWQVVGVMLAAPLEYYQQQTIELMSTFCAQENISEAEPLVAAVAQRLNWVERNLPRKFGNVLQGEVQQCKDIATAHGVVLDPIWTLAAWETAVIESERNALSGTPGVVIMLHTGGTLGLCGLAQRYPEEF